MVTEFGPGNKPKPKTNEKREPTAIEREITKCLDELENFINNPSIKVEIVGGAISLTPINPDIYDIRRKVNSCPLREFTNRLNTLISRYHYKLIELIIDRLEQVIEESNKREENDPKIKYDQKIIDDLAATFNNLTFHDKILDASSVQKYVDRYNNLFS